MIHKARPKPVAPDNTVRPDLTQNDDRILSARMRAFTVSAASKLLFQFQNREGIPYDLTDLEDCRFEAFIREMVSGAKPTLLEVTVDDAENGLLLITIPATLLNGGYRGTVTMLEGDTPILTNNFRLMVSTDSPHGPPSLQEIRMHIRDTMSAENLLTEDRAFSDEEIMGAMERALRYWNETPPSLDRLATTQNFPYKHFLIEGTLGQLYMVAAEDFRKNSLQYQAGGLSVADKEKEANYQRAAQMHWQAYQQFVLEKKSELNVSMGWGVVPSPYSYIYYH